MFRDGHFELEQLLYRGRRGIGALFSIGPFRFPHFSAKTHNKPRETKSRPPVPSKTTVHSMARDPG